ncbi:AAA family ATPase [Geopsychrobacter electrodiphilus]|uniref:AAA family ATPase n=1 Tax=Geopsychrobacter electrodiphilus TaxID=225196 RepID=UPI00037851AE|nr:AAA family ATPase [Geopsychrobacter electrodiphilus]
MSKKIFIAATGQDCGKTTTSLSLIHLARKKYKRVGFIKPFGPKLISYKGRKIDMDAALISHIYRLDDDLEFMSPVVVESRTTRQFLDGEITHDQLVIPLDIAIAELERKCDFLIIEGAGHAGVGAVVGLSNALVAARYQAPVLLVTGGGVGHVIDSVHLNLALFREAGAEVRVLVPNKLIPAKRPATLSYIEKAFANYPFKVVGGFNYSPVLANPTLRHIANLLGLQLHATAEQSWSIAHHLQMGAAATQRVVDLLQPSTLLVVTSSRDELLVMLASLYHLPEFKSKIAGLVIPGLSPVADIVQRILNDAGIPYMRTTATTADVFSRIREDVSKIGPDDHEKIALIQQLAETELCFETIDALI